MSNLDAYGFQICNEHDVTAFAQFQEHYLPILVRRERRWHTISQGNTTQRSAKLKRFVRKGIPSEMRAQLWMIMSGAQKRKLEAGTGYYASVLRNTSGDAEPSIASSLRVIKEDLHRTYPENIHFRSMSSDKMSALNNVLTAFVRQNPQIGYCQGLNYVTGMLLLAVRGVDASANGVFVNNTDAAVSSINEEKVEETVFWLLDTLVTRILPAYYEPSLKALRVDVQVLARLVRHKSPAVAMLLEREGADLALICPKWFICLFADVLPPETTFRIWDCLFYEGSKLLFRVSLTLVLLNNSRIMRCQTLPDIMKVLKEDLVANCAALHCHEFMSKIFSVPGSLSKSLIKKTRNEVLQQLN